MPTTWGYKKDRSLYLYARHVEKLDDFMDGERLRITIERDRNGKYNSLFHVLLGLLVRAINRGPAQTDIKGLKNWVKIKKGYYDVVPLPSPTVDGQTHAVEYKSTSFAKMGEEAFHAFTMDACELIRAELAPWVASAPEWEECQTIIESIIGRAENGRT